MSFTLFDLTEKSKALLAKAKKQLDAVDIEHDSLPESIYIDNKPISLVFAGTIQCW